MVVTPTGPSEPASAPNQSRISSGCAWRNSATPMRGGELGLAQLMVAAQHHQHRLAVGHQHQALHLRRLRQAGELRRPRRWSCGRACGTLRATRSPAGSAEAHGGRRGDGLFQIRRVAAARADGDEILAGIGGHHELVRLAAAHGAGVRFDHDVLQAAALEDAAVGLVVLFVGGVESGLIHVEGVGVLHDELAHAQQAGFGARFVAELGLDLIPDLRQLLVAAQFAAGDGGHDLFVRHGEAEVAAEAVLQAEQVVAHDVPAAGFLPDFGRIERGQVASPARRWRPSPGARSAGF